jgi:prolyl-tRNA editing enzyme YbaK/EbsC (Cys-tRNA(Pro) deacylase)
MSKSVNRVRAALEAHGQMDTIQEMPSSTRTAQDAAAACGCTLDQIVKSLIFETPDNLVLLLIAGGNTADTTRIAAQIGQHLSRADPARVRNETGFAIGGVAPLGHLTPVRVLMDPALLTFEIVWAAAGTPRHVFSIAPNALQDLTGAEILL